MPALEGTQHRAGVALARQAVLHFSYLLLEGFPLLSVECYHLGFRDLLKKGPARGGRKPSAGLGQMHTDLGKRRQPFACYEHTRF